MFGDFLSPIRLGNGRKAFHIRESDPVLCVLGQHLPVTYHGVGTHFAVNTLKVTNSGAWMFSFAHTELTYLNEFIAFVALWSTCAFLLFSLHIHQV